MSKRIRWRRLVALSLAACGGSTIGGTGSGGAPNAACTSCAQETLSWGFTGGRVAHVDRSAITLCRTFTRWRLDRAVDAGSCSSELGDCGSPGVAIGDVEAALADPDVRAALGAPSPPLYGIDERPTDGSVFQITAGTASIEIGSDCTETAKGCVPIPAGVRALGNLLRALDVQELAAPACAAFPRP